MKRVARFIDRFYKPERLTAFPGRRERIIADREDDIRLYGKAIINHHDSITGKVETIKG